MSEQPKTAEEFMALPEGGGFGAEDRTLPDGRIVRVPLAPDLVAFYLEEDTVKSCVDGDGGKWLLNCYRNGQYVRRRVG